MVYTALNGTLQSQNYPQSYFPNLNCSYTIQVPSDHRIWLTFDDVDLQPPNAQGCIDYITIEKSQEDQAVDILCRSTDRTVQSSGTWMRVTFITDHVIQASGFHAKYVAVKVCENTTYSLPNGILKSPGYPRHYLNNLDCYFTIDVSRTGHVIELSFHTLRTETGGTSFLSGDGCNRDFIEVFDGVRVIRWCGDWSSKLSQLNFRASDTVLTVRFVADDVITDVGFLATWQMVLKDTSGIPCQEGWLTRKDYCFLLVDTAKPWGAAQQECEPHSGFLARVDSPEISDFLSENIKQR